MAVKSNTKALLERIETLEKQVSDYREEIEKSRKNELKYRRIIDLAQEGILLLDPNQNILYANTSAKGMLGFDASQLLGKRLESFYDKSTVEFFSASKNHLSFEAEIQTRDKKRTPMLFNRTTLQNDSGQIDGYMSFLIDLSELKFAKDQKKLAEQRYRRMYENAVQGMFRSAVSGRMHNVNPAYARFLGYASSEEILALGESATSFYYHPADREKMIAALYKKRILINYELKLKRQDGDPVWALANVRLVETKNREPIIEGILVDNTENKRSERKLQQSEEKFRQLSIRDALTGLYNTRYLYKALDSLIADSIKSRKPFSLIFMDMDNFKSVVDTHGHLNGSKSLQQVAGTIRQCLTPPSFGVAYGGDEFVLVLQNTGKSHARKKAEEIKTSMKQTAYLETEGLQLRLGASFGIATYPDDAKDRTGLLALADQAMFHVKSKDKGAIGVSPSAPETDVA